VSAEQPSVEALVERVRSGIRIHPDEPTDVMVMLETDAFAALDSLTAALERAERERDEARVYERQDARNYWIASRNEWKARAQKAEAVVEAARRAMKELGVPGDGYAAPVANAYELLDAALTAYDEPPTDPSAGWEPPPEC
jgi:hypothetical protein